MSMNSTELLQAEITDLRRQRDDALRARDENAAELRKERESNANLKREVNTANHEALKFRHLFHVANAAKRDVRQAYRELVEAARAATALSENEAAEQEARRDDVFWTRLEMNPFGCPEREPEYDPDAA